jgi:hypothetical protein
MLDPLAIDPHQVEIHREMRRERNALRFNAEEPQLIS